jgi:predicted permease
MTRRETSQPRLMRWLLACLPLGGRRAEVEADLTELFEIRARTRGRLHAAWRLLRDIFSVMAPPRPLVRRRRGQGSGGLGAWLLDLRHGVRLFGKHPAAIGATVGGLALSIAVATTVFTILNASVIRPYGMDDPASVVRVQMLVSQGMSTAWPYHAFADMRERVRLSRVEAAKPERARFSTTALDTPARVDSLLLVSGGYLPALGGRAVLGRTLQPSDDEVGAAPVVVLNHRFWTSRLNGDAGIVGKTVWLSGTPVTVVGVVDPAFTGPVDTPPAFWAPFGSYGAIFHDRGISRTSAIQVNVIARVAANVERAAAEQELSAVAVAPPDVGIRAESGRLLAVTGVRLDGASSPMDGRDAAGMLLVVGVILLMVGLVLALACANVANLLLAGAAARTREIGVRLALGASRGRIARQLLGESVLIGLMAGGAGLALSLWLVPVVVAAIGPPEAHNVRPDAAVFLFTAVIAALSGAGAGLTPARHGSRGDLVAVLKSQGAQPGGPPAASRSRRWFIGVQAAASILLLVTAALFLRSALHMTRLDVGFEPDRLATVTPTFPRADFQAETAVAYWRSALDEVRALPQVERASLALYPPFGGAISLRNVDVGGVTYRIYENRTDAEYFATAGFRIVRGRGYSPEEVRADAPVAVVSESIVRDFLDGAEPIGSTLSAVADSLSGIRIVGVAAEAVTARLRGRGNGTIYRPLPPGDLRAARLVVRAEHPPAIVRDLERALLAVDPRVRPIASVVSDDVDRYMNEPKLLAAMTSAVAGLALVLAVLGLYGVTTFVVSQRMWELHVRQAIGASTHDIVRLLVRQSLTPVLIGLVAGLTVALAAVRVLAPALVGVSPYDPAAILGAVGVLIAAALTAVVAPALRAAHADPAAVLRQSQ